MTWRASLAVLVLMLAARPAAAESSETETTSPVSVEESEEGTEEEEEEDPNRFEIAPFPALGGNTDTGFSFGIDGRLSRLGEGYDPYRYSIHLNVVMSVKTDPNGDAELPMHNYVAELDFPGLAGGHLRLEPRIGFLRTVNQGWFGLAGLRTDPDPLSRLDLSDEWGGRRFQFVNMYALGALNMRWRFSEDLPLELLVGVSFRYIMPLVYQDSLLAEEIIRWHDLDGEPLILGHEWHPWTQLRVGLLWDRRDHEIAPTRGTMVEVSTRGSLAFPGEESLAYMGITADFRLFVPLIDRQRLVLASRVLIDVLLGDVPFYELTWVGSFTHEGYTGDRNVRAAPEGRHAGAGKVIGGVELRSLFAPFRLFNMNMIFGLVFFLTVGHSWTTLDPQPPYLNAGGSSTWGTGLGLLLRWGETIMVRIEAGYSPDSTDAGWPIGLYFTLGYAY